MNTTSIYYQNIIKRDLLNKFLVKNILDIPAINKINFNFNFNSYNYDLLLAGTSALKILSNQKFFFIKAKTPNKQLRLRKGAPIGCKVLLRKRNKFIILNKLIKKKSVFWKTENLFNKKHIKSMYDFKINNVFSFNNFTNYYFLFSNLHTININVCVFFSNTKSFYHSLFLIKSFNIK